MRNYVTSREAIALLDVKLQTLYAYVSRGLIHSAPVNDGSKERLYLRADIEKLRLRAEARSGHGAVAACVPAGGTKVVSRAIPAVRFRRLTLRSATGTAQRAVPTWGALPDEE